MSPISTELDIPWQCQRCYCNRWSARCPCPDMRSGGCCLASLITMGGMLFAPDPGHLLIDTTTSHRDNVQHSGPPSPACHTKTKTRNLVIKCGIIVSNENECWYWVVLVLVLCPAIEAINQRVFRKQLSITADQLARVVCGIVCRCSLQLSAN